MGTLSGRPVGILEGWRRPLPLLLLASCAVPQQGLTLPWFRIERVPPLLVVPHLLQVGAPRHRAFRREGERWAKVYDGPVTGVVAADGGAAVVLQGPRLLLRADAAEAIVLDPGACPGVRIAVTDAGDRLVCVDLAAGASPHLSVAQLDTRGKVLRTDRIGPDAARPWSAAGEDPESWRLVGLTPDREPVVALRTAAAPRRFQVRLVRGTTSEVIEVLEMGADSIHSWGAEPLRTALGLAGVRWSTYAPEAPRPQLPR